MKYFLTMLSLALYLSMVTTVSAGTLEKNKGYLTAKNVKLGIHTKLVNVKAGEFVYIGSHKLSELIWETRNAFMLGGDASVTLIPSWGVKLNVSGSKAVHKGNSVMDDYDWLITGAPWTHWSNHPNTTLENGLILDANLSVNLYKNRSETVSLDLLAGYKRDQWKWGASGGTFIYSGLPGFRDISGTFSNIPVISYEQTVSTPYVGVDFKWNEEWLTLNLKFIGSNYASAKAVDNHWLRTLRVTDTFRKGQMYGGDIGFTYHHSDNLTFDLNYSFQSYSENRGDASYLDTSTGIVTPLPDGAAMSLGYQTIELGMNYSF